MCLLDPFGAQAGRGESVARTMVPVRARRTEGCPCRGPGLRDLTMVNAAVGGDRGPPNSCSSCSLARRRFGNLAWVYRWNLLVAELQDPADD